MLKLTNIKVEKSVISCDYYPEHTSLKGSIALDVEKDIIVSLEMSQYPAGRKMYVAQALSKMRQLYRNKDNIPIEAFSAWY